MLTPPAFNALLKTLEEPPAHAIFILATTEPHKLPQTILSRCQRFDFRRIPLQAAISHLSNIVSQEGLKIEPAVLEFIARTSTGSLRDAISLLDQLAAYGDEEITMAQARIILGTASAGAVADLVKFLAAGQLGEGLRAIRDALDEGTDVHQLASQVVEYLRRVMLVHVSPDDGPLDVTAEELDGMREIAQRTPRPWLLQALRRFNDLEFELKTSLEPQLSLELAFLESALSAEEQGNPFLSRSHAPARKEPGAPKTKATKPAPPEVAPVKESEVEPTAAASDTDSNSHREAKREAADRQPQVATAPAKEEDDSPTSVESRAPEAKPPKPAPTEGEDASGVSQVNEKWPLVLQAVRPLSRSVEAILRDCEPMRTEGEVIVLGFSYDFHKKRMENSEHKSFIEETLSELLGRPCIVRFELLNKEEPDPQPTGSLQPQILEDPLVQEAVGHLGAQVVAVRPNKKSPAQAEPSDSDDRAEGSTPDSGDPGTSE